MSEKPLAESVALRKAIATACAIDHEWSGGPLLRLLDGYDSAVARLREREQAATALLRDAKRAMDSESMKLVTGSAWAHGVFWKPEDCCDGAAIDAFLAAALAAEPQGGGK